MITAVICDLDGLLADTETLHLRAYVETLSSYNIELNTAEYQSHWIRDGLGIADYIEEHGLCLNPRVLHGQKASMYQTLVANHAEPMPGAVAFLNRVHKMKRLALASNSYRDDIEIVLKRLGVVDHFEVISSRDDVTRTKPFPDIFLHTAEQLDVEPSDCVVLEDAQKGVEAAARAGMKCIAVPNQFTLDNDFSKATTVVTSLEDITLDFIDSL